MFNWKQKKTILFKVTEPSHGLLAEQDSESDRDDCEMFPGIGALPRACHRIRVHVVNKS